MDFGSLAAAAQSSPVGTAQAQMFARKEASKSRRFTREMMKNKHQWQADDLEKAGLNRILSLTQGAPMGSSAQASAAESSMTSQRAAKKQASTARDVANSTIDVNRQNAQLLSAQASSAQSQASIDSMREQWIKTHPDEFNALMNKESGIGFNVSTAKSVSEIDQVRDAVKGIPEKAKESRGAWEKQVEAFLNKIGWRKYFPKKSKK